MSDNIDIKQKEYLEDTAKKKKGLVKASAWILDFFTYLCSSLTILGVIAIFVFVFSRGWKNLNWSYFSGDYEPQVETFMAKDSTWIETNDFKYDDLKEGEYFSTRWGIALKDGVGNGGKREVVITYIDPNSPFYTEVVEQANSSQLVHLKTGWNLTGLTGFDQDGKTFTVATETALPKEYSSYSQWYATTLDKATTFISGKFILGGDGFRGSFVTTMYTILLSLAICLPFGVGGAVYLGVYAKKNRITNIIRSAIDLLSGIPSIVFGLVGALIFIPMFSAEGKGSVLSGCFTLAIMILPIIVKNTEEAIKVVPKNLTQASLALGASQTETIFKVILPNSLSGILTGVILAIGRVIGESASLIFAVGVNIKDNIILNQSATTLAVHIWKIMAGENPNYDAACTISIVILFMVLVLNILLSIASKYLNKFDTKPNKTWFGLLFDKTKQLIKKSKKEVKANA